jgi:amidohydrolase
MSSPTTAARVLEGLDQIRTWLEDFYRHLHEHPELSHQERQTAASVEERLAVDGYQVISDVGGTGVVGILRNGDGPTVLLRADMDALPIPEATGLPYASTVTAPDDGGTAIPVMHACGHDVHVTALLGAAALMAASRDHWSGCLVVVFQPAEEVGDGAQGCLTTGWRR